MSRSILTFVVMMLHATMLVLASSSSDSLSSSSAQMPSVSASSSQPLWSYQSYRPSSQLYTSPSSSLLADTFSGLSGQRQGALSSSPLLTILPIILIAAGGFMLLLPFITMILSPGLGGGFGATGGFGAGQFGFPGQLAKKRSLDDTNAKHLAGGGSSKGLVDLFDQVASSIEEMTRKFASNPTSNSHTNSSNNNHSKQTSAKVNT